MSKYQIDIQISVDTDEEPYHEYLDWLDSEKNELTDIAKMDHLMAVLNEPYQINRSELVDLDVEMNIEKSST
jgi:hypothetical protein